MTAKTYPLQHKKIWVAGHRGMVGSAVIRRLQSEDFNILTCDIDLRQQDTVRRWLQEARPDGVILAAARVGGIGANDLYPADFLYDNLMIESNVIHAAYENNVEKLLFLGSSCIYPRDAAQPITEDALLTAPLEPTNQWYAVAKIAGIKLCQAYRRQYGCNFIAAMPCNLYGPGDRFDAEKSHVIPALMLKMEQAKQQNLRAVEIWGSGTPLREFLYVDDLADALVFLLQNYAEESHINVGSGNEISIAALAQQIAVVVGYEGDLIFDKSKPDGTPRKLMDNSRITALGWQAQTDFADGLRRAYEWYSVNVVQAEAA